MKKKSAERKFQIAVRLEIRRRQLLSCIPDIADGKSLLYVGANVRRMEMLNLFFGAGCEIDILEVWPKNVRGLRKWNEAARAVRSIIHGSVLDFAREKSYDTVIWWHGPEHVPYGLLDNALAAIERAASRLVVLACPWGDVPQDEAYGNPFERHRFATRVEMFTDRGYAVNCSGEFDVLGSNLLAWKRIG